VAHLARSKLPCGQRATLLSLQTLQGPAKENRVKRLFGLGVLFVVALLASCDDGDARRRDRDSGADAGTTRIPGVCELARCPKPASGVACCTPDAQCGSDAPGLGLSCQANDESGSTRKCVLADCPTPVIGEACCTPRAQCGWDPFASGLLCLANAQINLPKDAGAPPQLCDLDRCPKTDGGPAPCCQLNGQCGADTLGVGLCFPPPTCDLSKCPASFEGRACCQASGECGVDVFGIGLCFPPPVPLCDLGACPAPDGGAKACCLQNGQCGVDTLGIGLCFPPPPEPTCDLARCPKSPTGLLSCCLPNGACGVDSLGIGLCFAPPPTAPDGGVPPITEPPDDPSITGECPSFLGPLGPIWGCCSPYGVCGTFAASQCLLPVGTQLPVGPPPAAEAGVSEPFLRCKPPPVVR
jgi:hypothetical protein